MAIEVIAKIMEYDLPPREKYILILYSNYSNPEGEGVWPSQSTMAMISGYSRKTINEVTKTLSTCKLLLLDGKTKHGTINWKINTKWKGDKADIDTVTKGLQPFKGVTKGSQQDVTKGSHNTSDDTPVKNIKQKTTDAIAKGNKLSNTIQVDFQKHLGLTPNWDTKTNQEYYQFFRERYQAGQTAKEFVKWWRADWKGKDGGLPSSLNQVQTLWMQAFKQSEEQHQHRKAI